MEITAKTTSQANLIFSVVGDEPQARGGDRKSEQFNANRNLSVD